VDIHVPLLRDAKTDAAELAQGIQMDAMAYGMGCCCLQVTFQARDIDESRHLYDHLAVLAPVMLALTAATPVLHGRLADTDVRWATVAASVDDRTPFERGVPPDESAPRRSAEDLAPLAGGGVAPLPKSRYESISVYLANCGGCMKRYNDLDAPVDVRSLERLLDGGVDEDLARHVAHLFVRDPLVIMKSRLRLDDAAETDHFENLQGTNWQTVRWKPPPRATACGPQVGWRVEFRSMEVQLTDFENAAFTTFVVLVSRVILAFDLNLYLPLTKVDENMRRAHNRDAVLQQRFWFRKHMAPPEMPVDDPDACEVRACARAASVHGPSPTSTVPTPTVCPLPPLLLQRQAHRWRSAAASRQPSAGRQRATVMHPLPPQHPNPSLPIQYSNRSTAGQAAPIASPQRRLFSARRR